MEIHGFRGLDSGEIIYKDTMGLGYVAKHTSYEKKGLCVQYKNAILPHNFFADFVSLMVLL